MRPQELHENSHPAFRIANPLQWLPTSFDIPMLPQQFNLMNYFGNSGASNAFVPPAMLMPSHFMHVQSAPAQVVHQQPASSAESGLIRTHEYPISVKDAFCKWKEDFLSGEVEPENTNFPVLCRPRTWLTFLKPKWSAYKICDRIPLAGKLFCIHFQCS